MVKKLLLIFIVSLPTINLYSQAPANDCPCNAVPLSVGSGCINGDNTSATLGTCESSVNECSLAPDPWNATVWYSFVATDDSLTVNFGDGTLGTNTVGGVYSASSCTGTMTCLGSTKNGSEIDVTGLIIGATYYIAVDGAKQGTTQYEGTFCISIYETPPPPPVIGTCQNPRTLYPGPDCKNVQGTQYDEQNNMISTDTGTNGGPDGGGAMTGTSTWETSCMGTTLGDNTYWVEFYTGSNTSITFSNCTDGCSGSTSEDIAIYPMGIDCTATTESSSVACVNDLAAGGSSTVSSLSANTWYMAMISGGGTNNPTSAFLCLTAATPYSPSNDNCSSATVITTGTNYVINNSNATVDNNNSLCSGSTENNVWAVWTADFTGTAYVNLQNQDCIVSNGMQMSLYQTDGTCNTNNWSCLQYINPNNDNDFFGTINAVAGVTYYIQFDGYAGAGCTFDFCITTSSNPNCELLILSNYRYNYFVKVVEERKVELNWNINESNIKNFVIERGTDLENFKAIQTVSNRGNVQYSFTDDNPNKGINYYRLRFVDLSGGVNYSEIKSANITNYKQLEVIPNPVSDKMTIEFDANTQQDTKVEIYDISGRIVFQTTIKSQKGANTSTIDISSLQNGIYFIYVQKDDIVIKERFVKQ